MRKSCFFFFSFLLLIVSHSFAQHNALKPFKIEGHINVDTGKLILNIENYKQYYPKGPETITAIIKDGRFSFEGLLASAGTYNLTYGNRNTESFFIEEGTQTVTCNVDSFNKVPLVHNKIMKEYREVYLPYFSVVNFKRDAVDKKWAEVRQFYNNKVPEDIKLSYSKLFQEGYAASDQALLKFITEHPDSYVGLWKLIHLFPFGYYNIFDEMAGHFSPAILNSYAGKMMSVNLKQMGIRGIGSKFPSLNSKNERGEKLDSVLYSKNKYTLIDFWYSSCIPCAYQFESFKETYAKYKLKGFEIAGVSVDKTSDKKDMENAIKKHKINWQHYWDKDGVEAKRLLITAYPTNFLLDQNGVIIKSNISPPELREFLQNKLQKTL